MRWLMLLWLAHHQHTTAVLCHMHWYRLPIGCALYAHQSYVFDPMQQTHLCKASEPVTCLAGPEVYWASESWCCATYYTHSMTLLRTSEASGATELPTVSSNVHLETSELQVPFPWWEPGGHRSTGCLVLDRAMHTPSDWILLVAWLKECAEHPLCY